MSGNCLEDRAKVFPSLALAILYTWMGGGGVKKEHMEKVRIIRRTTACCKMLKKKLNLPFVMRVFKVLRVQDI